MPFTKHVSFRLQEGTLDDQREKIIGDLHHFFLVSIAGTNRFGVIPFDTGRLDEVADHLRSVDGVDATSVKIE
jgi:hypothetical protein